MRLVRGLTVLSLAGVVCWGSSAIAGGRAKRVAAVGHNHGAGPCYEHVEGESMFNREKTLKLGGPFIAKKNPYTQADHTFDRAGAPNLLGSHARPTITPYYCGDYVGGGAAYYGGEPRRVNEGTWGWDYMGGRWLPGRIFLDWSHGRRYQGGTGRYETDPPFEVPNVFNNKLPRLRGSAEEAGE